jgi:predicted polyphosphate/ATP-dependent NAD kinase
MPGGTKRLGLIVNPVAGLGGRVGLKGSDGAKVQNRARELGAQPQALDRTVQALSRISGPEDVEIVTYPGEMGEAAAGKLDFQLRVIGTIREGETTAADTIRAARELRAAGLGLLLFTGGDGTARDIYDAVGESMPVLGIPAGVKIHSGVYATNPGNAGELACRFLSGRPMDLREAEVMDIDEVALRRGVVAARIYGYLKIPFQPSLVQSVKSGTPQSERAARAAIAAEVVERMEQDMLYVVGPGTTTREVLTRLGFHKTLIGVDIVTKNHMVAADVGESRILELCRHHPAGIIVTPIGGQGFIFGRGNQQISAPVIRQIGRENILVISTADKIHSLRGKPLLVDTGDPLLDRDLQGYRKIITGYHMESVYPVSK